MIVMLFMNTIKKNLQINSAGNLLDISYNNFINV